MSKPRAYVSDFSMHFGPITTRGRLMPIRVPDKAPKLHYCTPEGLAVKQCYIDDNGKTFAKEELGRAVIDDDGNVTPVNAEAIEEAKTSQLPLNTLSVTTHSIEDIEQYLFPSNNNAYIFEPVIKVNNKIKDDPVNSQWHEWLNYMVRNTEDVAFIGMCNLRNFEGLFRLSHYQGYLVVQKQLYPESLHQYDALDIQLDEPSAKKAVSLASAMVKPFNPEDYANSVAERLAVVTSEEFDPSTMMDAIAAPTVAEFNIADAVDAFLADA